MLWIIKTFWRTIVTAGTWLGILSAPKDASELPEALKLWGPIMPTQEHLLYGFSALLVVWIFWTDLRPLLANTRIFKLAKGLRVDPPDIVLAKKEISDFAVDHLNPCYNSVYEALRVGSIVYKPKNQDGNICQLVSLGIMSRAPLRDSVSNLLDKETIRRFNTNGLEDLVVTSISRYLAASSMLNTVCGSIIIDGGYTDSRKYVQKDGNNFFDLVQKWSIDHAAFELAAVKLAQGSNFPSIKHAVGERRILTSNFNGEKILEFIAEHKNILIS